MIKTLITMIREFITRGVTQALVHQRVMWAEWRMDIRSIRVKARRHWK
jgi:hypothetical protein